MATGPNQLRWTGEGGHYEVYYLTATEPRSGVGLWIRYTMLAPRAEREKPTCTLWFLAMDPRAGAAGLVARQETFPIERMQTRADPFELRIGEAVLAEDLMFGSLGDVWWDLRWSPSATSYHPVHPALGRLGLAHTVFVLPQPHVMIEGAVGIGSDQVELSRVPAGQAHLWGSKHATRWAWAHCGDLLGADGHTAPDTFLDGVSAFVTRLGRPVGPSTPLVGRIRGEEFLSTSPLRMIRNASRFGLEGWRFEATSGRRRLVGEVEAPHDRLAGVTYHDPDGEKAYCYNTETASLRLEVQDRAGGTGGWGTTEILHSPGRCHFECGQRTPAPGVELLIR